jgi:tetratricopeptide (TPR) repeat protein
MFCTACGTKNFSESNFCKQCGLKLEKQATVRISEEEFERARPEEEQVSALLERAYIRRADGDLAGAVTLCEEALRINVDSTSAHSLLGQLHAERGERDDAVREYERVLQLNPGSIADRVKLDELRADREEADTRLMHPRPRIVLTEQKFSPERTRNGLALVGIAAGLMLLGAALAMQLRPQTTAAADTRNAGKTETPERMASQSGGQTDNRPVSQGGGADVQTAAASVPQTQGINPFGMVTPLFSNESTTLASPPARQYAPPNYTGNQNPPAFRNEPRLPNMTGRETNSNSRATPNRTNNDGNRVHLQPQEDGVTEGGDGRYIIRVNAGGGTGNNSTDTQESANGGNSASGGTQRGTPGNGGTKRPDIGNPPLSDANANIAMGDDLKSKGEFTRAIHAYNRAAPNAGDEAGFVYQKIARCYQEKGDRQSAINNYQKAVTELNKLITAGRKTEMARDTIRVCENGIKICQSEG